MTFQTWMKTSCLWLACVLATPVWADRVKDLATLAAQRPNQLIGFGLVVGLQGTGDDASVPFTTQSMKALLAQMGVRIDGPMSDFEQVTSASRIDIKNAAAVMVTADLPGFAKPGQRIDVNISAIGNARSGLPINVLITRNDVLFTDAAGAVYTSAGAGRTAVINTPGGGSTRATRRPDLIAGVNPYLNDDRSLLNPAAFTTPKAGSFGNLPRNFLRGPNFRQFDLTFNKQFQVSEKANLEFRTEVFNIFNMTNFANPGGTLGAPAASNGLLTIQPGQAYTRAAAGTTFGLLTSTVEKSVGLGANRQIQFAMKVNF